MREGEKEGEGGGWKGEVRKLEKREQGRRASVSERDCGMHTLSSTSFNKTGTCSVITPHQQHTNNQLLLKPQPTALSTHTHIH